MKTTYYVSIGRNNIKLATTSRLALAWFFIRHAAFGPGIVYHIWKV